MLGERKRSILNLNLKKTPRQIQHHVIDRKTELLAKIIFAKRSILGVSQVLSSRLTATNQTFYTNCKTAISHFLGTMTLTTQDFTCLKSKIETLKKNVKYPLSLQ